MAFTAEGLLEGKQPPVSVKADEPVQKALELMVENDFSQLPVIDDQNKPQGLITGDSILRGLNNFGVTVDLLRTRDVAENARKYHLEDGIFDLLDGLNDRPAVLIVDNEDHLTGIVTHWDTTAYFRRRAENMMLVEDIETTLQEHIRAAFSNPSTAEVDERALQESIDTISSAQIYSNTKTALTKYIKLMDTHHTPKKEWIEEACAVLIGNSKSLTDLTLYQKIELLLHKSRWPNYSVNFSIDDKALRHLFEGVHKTRNVLAHFRDEITQAQQAQLRFCVRWLEQNQPVFPEPIVLETVSDTAALAELDEIIPVDEEISESDSRYTLLAIYLQNRSLKEDKLLLSFEDIEAVIESPLPASARRHRSWWANDSVSHVQSIQWLEAGWRVSNINFTEGRVTFNRIRDRERAYIDFFNQLMNDLRAKADLPVRETSPMGASWINILHLPRNGNGQPGILAYSFAQNRRFRVELYIDTFDEKKNKQVFDRLKNQRAEIEADLGTDLTWERLDTKRASRIVLYCPNVSITDSEPKLSELRLWAVDAMIRFEKAIVDRAEAAFADVLSM